MRKFTTIIYVVLIQYVLKLTLFNDNNLSVVQDLVIFLLIVTGPLKKHKVETITIIWFKFESAKMDTFFSISYQPKVPVQLHTI